MTSVSYCVSLSRAAFNGPFISGLPPFPPLLASIKFGRSGEEPRINNYSQRPAYVNFPDLRPRSLARSLAPLRARILALVIPPRSERELWRLRACLVVFTSLFHLTAPKLKHSPRGPSDGRNGGIAPSSLPSIDISQWRSRPLHFPKNVGHVRGRPGSATMRDIFASYSMMMVQLLGRGFVALEE